MTTATSSMLHPQFLYHFKMECLWKITYLCCFGTLRPQIDDDVEIKIETTPHSDLEPPLEIVTHQPSPLPLDRCTFYYIRQNLETSETEVYGIPVYQMELLEQPM